MNRRTSLVTAATVAGTILAGSAAVAANIGVLSAAEDNSIGNLSAEATVASPTTIAEAQVVDIYLEDPTPGAHRLDDLNHDHRGRHTRR